MKRFFRAWETIEPTRFIGFILFIIAWSNGQISGALAWSILLLFVGFTIKLKRG